MNQFKWFGCKLGGRMRMGCNGFGQLVGGTVEIYRLLWDDVRVTI